MPIPRLTREELFMQEACWDQADINRIVPPEGLEYLEAKALMRINGVQVSDAYWVLMTCYGLSAA